MAPQDELEAKSPADSTRPRGPRTLAHTFADAFAGLAQGFREERNFVIHFCAAAAVLVAGVALKIDRVEWCLVVGCIFAVLAAEMFNTAVERVAKAFGPAPNEHLRRGLNMSSAAVLLVGIGAAVIGAIIFLR